MVHALIATLLAKAVMELVHPLVLHVTLVLIELFQVSNAYVQMDMLRLEVCVWVVITHV